VYSRRLFKFGKEWSETVTENTIKRGTTTATTTKISLIWKK